LIGASREQRGINLEENFIQRQGHLDLVAIAAGRKELRRRAAQFAKCDPNRSRRKLGEDFVERNRDRGFPDIGLPDAAFEVERKRAENGLEGDFDTVAVGAGERAGRNRRGRGGGGRLLGRPGLAGFHADGGFGARLGVVGPAVKNFFQEIKHMGPVE
jgi:hypothetical protein